MQIKRGVNGLARGLHHKGPNRHRQVGRADAFRLIYPIWAIEGRSTAEFARPFLGRRFVVMDLNPTRPDDRRGRILCVVLTLLFGLIVVEPLRMRFRAPSIYADDVVRIAQVRTMPLSEMAVRPFNEHLAPLFELVTWTVWTLSGGRLTHAPLGFTLASLLPFALCEIALVLLVRRETLSWTAAMVGVAVFGLSWLPIETAWWYSASSFTWSLLGVLIAWNAALRPGWRGTAVSLLAALAAPAFSMIGILAGPIATFRAIVGLKSAERGPLSVARAAMPLVGTSAFLLLVSLFGHREALEGSVRRNFRIWEAVGPTLRAPITVLLPGVAGVKNLDTVIPHVAACIICLAVSAVLLFLVVRRGIHAGLVVGGMGLIVLGYGLTYGARGGAVNLLNVQRYHLFPQVGLAMIVAAFVARFGNRFEHRPVARISLCMLVALGLLFVHRAELKGRARFLRFNGQAATLAAMEHVESLCESFGVGRDQALRELAPVRNRWFDFDLNALTMIAPSRESRVVRGEDIRPAILGGLTQLEREALWGGMDATPYTFASSSTETGAEPCLSQARLERAYRIQRPVNGEVSTSLPNGLSYLEFVTELSGPKGARPRLLRLEGLQTSGTVEVWWCPRSGRWTESRSFRLDPTGGDRKSKAVSISLDALPHWDSTRIDRLQIRFQGPGRVGMVAPRFLR